MSECYLCKRDTAVLHSFNKAKSGAYDLLECSECGFLRIDPLPETITINNLYSDIVESESKLEYEVFSSKLLTGLKKTFIIKPQLNRLRKSFNQSDMPRLLDVGCSTGWITSISRDMGFDVLGIEANEKRASFGREKYKIDIIEGYIEDIDFNEKFDAVTMFHLFEHLKDPAVILKKINSLLTADGKVLIVVPNSKSLGVRIFGRNYNWNVPDHISFFSPQTITAILQSEGFDVLNISHLISPPILIYSFNSMMRSRKKSGRFSFRISNPVVGNAIFVPVGYMGKLLRRGEVISVLAQKGA